MSDLLSIRDLTVDFDAPSGWLRALHGVDLDLRQGETLGLVGESGSGKSVTCLSVMRLHGPRVRIRGKILFRGEDLVAMREDTLTRLRGRHMAMIFQEPTTSLNPVKSIGRQLTEVLELHRQLSHQQARGEAVSLLNHVGIPDAERRLKEYPDQLSGGMNQRVMIAMALAGKPELLIADEPTTALDVTIQAQILDLIRSVGRETGMAVLLITHDLGIIAENCDRVAVMYAGRIVEQGPNTEVFANPHHPYTRGLLHSLPRVDRHYQRLLPIEGTVPSLHEQPTGCAFAPRCAHADDQCRRARPGLEELEAGHAAACFHPQSGPVSRPSLAEGAGTGAATNGEDMVVISDLLCHFRVRRQFGLLGRRAVVRAVDGVSFSIRRGETLGLVGESGCGKSTIAKLILNMIQPTDGNIALAGRDVTALGAAQWRALRRDVQMVFQDPLDALDPRMSAGDQIVEPLLIHGIGTRQDRRARAHELLDAVGLKSEAYDRFPHQLSGGQQQRVVLARALILEPKLIVCDEPISALDVSIQAQVINLLRDLQHKLNLTYLFISHDLRVVRVVCDRVAVMYLGKIVEYADRDKLFDAPAHPYTKALLSAIPIPDPTLERERILLAGDPPSPIEPPSGCRFHTRCPWAKPLCRQREPQLKLYSDGQTVACHVVHGEA